MPDPTSPPLVSVVVACRNAGPLLRDCLRQRQLDLVRKLPDRIGFIGALRRRVGPG